MIYLSGMAIFIAVAGIGGVVISFCGLYSGCVMEVVSMAELAPEDPCMSGLVRHYTVVVLYRHATRPMAVLATPAGVVFGAGVPVTCASGIVCPICMPWNGLIYGVFSPCSRMAGRVGAIGIWGCYRSWVHTAVLLIFIA
jgi:hypothetical protein